MLPPQAYGAQDDFAGAGHVELVPEQKDASEWVASVQLSAAHIAVEIRQFPAPSQTFVTPQGLVAGQLLSVEPAACGAQVPAALQA